MREVTQEIMSARREEAERYYLASLINHDPAEVVALSEEVTEGDLAWPDHRAIYNAAIQSATEGKPPTINGIVSRIQAAGGGKPNLTLARAMTHVSNLVNTFKAAPQKAEHWARAVKGLGVPPKVAQALERALEAISDGQDADSVVSRMRRELDATTLPASQTYSRGSIFLEAGREIEAYQKGEREGMYLPTSLPSLNRHITGWPRKALSVIAARPGQGKSSLWEQEVIHAARRGRGSIIMALEMDASRHAASIVKREAYDDLAACGGLEVDRRRLHNERATRAFVRAAVELASLPVYWVETSKSGKDVNTLLSRAEACYQAAEDKIDFLVVDYIQQITDSELAGASRREEIGRAFGKLLDWCKERSIAGIIIAQFNRAVDRADRKPTKADIRECGAIEQDADLLIFPHHANGPDSAPQHPAEFIIDKCRAGGPGSVEVIWDGPRKSFLEPSARAQYSMWTGQ